jgi:hypothetical protein
MRAESLLIFSTQDDHVVGGGFEEVPPDLSIEFSRYIPRDIILPGIRPQLSKKKIRSIRDRRVPRQVRRVGKTSDVYRVYVYVKHEFTGDGPGRARSRRGLVPQKAFFPKPA